MSSPLERKTGCLLQSKVMSGEDRFLDLSHDGYVGP